MKMTKVQYIGDDSAENLPEPARSRLLQTYEETQQISDKADAILVTELSGELSFKYEMSAPLPEMTPFERAQSICFVTRYEHLPTLNRLEIIEHNGKHYLRNIGFVRHILNEYRSLILNQKDSVYFEKIHSFCYSKLANKEPSKGMSVSVSHETNGDVTDILLKMIGERNKAIKYILKECEYDYIYNGILQHSDHNYTKRLIEEYHTGRLNHLFIKHAFLLGNIKELLWWHHRILNYLTFPNPGPI
jgi:hypothetical protein